MNSEQPLLTIGIPTWNRSKELQECIQLVAAQIGTCGEYVEIFVSDNASSDGTETMLRHMKVRLGFLRYVRNTINIGADQNFLRTLRESYGKYVWLLSDDDFITDGAVAEILRIIKNYEPSYINTNYLYCDDKREIVDLQPQRKFMVSHDMVQADINDMFSKRNHWLSFVSANIYRRKFLDFAEYETNKGRVPNWIQVYIAAHVLFHEPNGYLSSSYAVLSRVGNSRVSTFPFVIAMPEAFNYIFNRFTVDLRVARHVMKVIRTTFLPLRSFLAYRALNIKVSPLIVPNYYKLAALFPVSLILIAWKTKRFIGGKGFSVPEFRSTEGSVVLFS